MPAAAGAGGDAGDDAADARESGAATAGDPRAAAAGDPRAGAAVPASLSGAEAVGAREGIGGVGVCKAGLAGARELAAPAGLTQV
jgi:hypothetical protein